MGRPVGYHKTFKCEICGEMFDRTPSEISRGRTKYCSHECSAIASKNSVDKKCEICGENFTVVRSQILLGRGRFCSNKCSQASRSNLIKCTCVTCGKDFLRNASVIGNYCSIKCRGIAQRITYQYDCLQCGKHFTSKQKGRIFCSVKCMGAAKRSKIDCTCPICGKLFKQIPSKVSGSEHSYCSKPCAVASQRVQIERTCVCCGKLFTIARSQVKETGNYCSRRCSFLANRGNGSHFWRGGLRHYRGPNWPDQRELARKRDGDVCQSCGRKHKVTEKAFDVHHIKPFREFGDYLEANGLSNLILLCRKCHRRIELGLAPCPKHLL